MGKRGIVHKQKVDFLLSLYLYWRNKPGSTFMSSKAFEVEDEIIVSYLAGENTTFINLKRGNRVFSPAINTLTWVSGASNLSVSCHIHWSQRQWLHCSAGHRTEHHQGHITLLTSLQPPWAACCPFSVRTTHGIGSFNNPRPASLPKFSQVLSLEGIVCTGWWQGQLHKGISYSRQEGHSLYGGRWNQAFSPPALKLMECPCHSLGLCPYAHYNITIANETQVPPENTVELGLEISI